MDTAFDPDRAMLDAFRNWAMAEASDPLDDPPFDDDEDEMILAAARAIVRMPAAGTTGLAIKTYLALYFMCGGNMSKGLAGIDLDSLRTGTIDHDVAAGTLDGVIHFAPEIVTIVKEARRLNGKEEE